MRYAKILWRKSCKMFTSVYGIETVCLRYFNVYVKDKV